MAPTSRRFVEFRSVLYGLWFGALAGGVIVTLIRPVFYPGTAWLDMNGMIRNTVVYVLPIVIVASFTLLPALVRYDKLNLSGFTFAGVVIGVLLSLLHVTAHHILNWFSDVSLVSNAYVLVSSILVAWTIWVLSRLAEFISLRSRRDLE